MRRRITSPKTRRAWLRVCPAPPIERLTRRPSLHGRGSRAADRSAVPPIFATSQVATVPVGRGGGVPKPTALGTLFRCGRRGRVAGGVRCRDPYRGEYAY